MPSYHDVLQGLDDWFARGRDAAGAGVVPCRRGCFACCLGPFDVSPADAELLARGLAALPAPERAALAARAARQARRYPEALPGWGPPFDVDAVPEDDFDALTEALAAEPCPALDAAGGCALHAFRPATCRMTGLPMDAGRAGRLDNECPIQDEHPAYAALEPRPFDLIAFEREAARHDAEAAARGWHTTTVAGALLKS